MNEPKRVRYLISFGATLLVVALVYTQTPTESDPGLYRSVCNRVHGESWRFVGEAAQDGYVLCQSPHGVTRQTAVTIGTPPASPLVEFLVSNSAGVVIFATTLFLASVSVLTVVFYERLDEVFGGQP